MHEQSNESGPSTNVAPSIMPSTTSTSHPPPPWLAANAWALLRPVHPPDPDLACPGCFEASLKGQAEAVPGLRKDGVREIRARYGPLL